MHGNRLCVSPAAAQARTRSHQSSLAGQNIFCASTHAVVSEYTTTLASTISHDSGTLQGYAHLGVVALAAGAGCIALGAGGLHFAGFPALGSRAAGGGLTIFLPAALPAARPLQISALLRTVLIPSGETAGGAFAGVGLST